MAIMVGLGLNLLRITERLRNPFNSNNLCIVVTDFVSLIDLICAVELSEDVSSKLIVSYMITCLVVVNHLSNLFIYPDTTLM